MMENQKKIIQDFGKNILNPKKMPVLSKRLKCLVCKKVFKTNQHLIRHNQLVHFKGEKNIQCDHCPHRSKDKSNLLNHIFKHTDQFKCTLCGYRGGCLRELNMHLLTHRSAELKCNICGLKYITKGLLEIHQQNHPDCDIKCPEPNCERSFPLQHKLRKHLLFHQKDYPFQCKFKECGKSFKVNDQLKKHQMVHSSLKFYMCIQCPKNYKTQNSLNNHVKNTHKAYLDVDFDTVQARKEIEHLQLKEEIKAIAAEDPFWYKKLSVDDFQIIAQAMPFTEIDRKLDCIICSKRFINRTTLTVHITNIHLNDKQPTFLCDHCGIIYKSKLSIQKHLQIIHSRKFMC